MLVAVEVDLPEGADIDALPARLETLIEAEGLKVGRRDTLAAYPGSIHWHIVAPGVSGTLEATLWPAPRRLWFAVHNGRTGVWIAPALARLKNRLEQNLEQNTDEK